MLGRMTLDYEDIKTYLMLVGKSAKCKVEKMYISVHQRRSFDGRRNFNINSKQILTIIKSKSNSKEHAVQVEGNFLQTHALVTSFDRNCSSLCRLSLFERSRAKSSLQNLILNEIKGQRGQPNGVSNVTEQTNVATMLVSLAKV